MNEEMKQIKHELNEKAKKLDFIFLFTNICLTKDIKIKEILEKLIELIQTAWQFPDSTAVRIKYGNIEYKTENFRETNWKLMEKIEIMEKVLSIEIYSLEENTFLPDEKELIKEILNRLKPIIELENLKLKLKEKKSEGLNKLSMLSEKSGLSMQELIQTTVNAELEQFAYVTSKDLQEPLRMVSTYVNLLSKTLKDELDDETEEYITFIIDGVKRMQKLIDDLVALSYISKEGKDFKPTNFNNAVELAIDILKEAIDDSNTVITKDELPTILADESQIIQLFKNLIGVSIIFRGEENPQIHISAKQIDDYWEFSLHDNGVSIAPSYYERTFVNLQRLNMREEYLGTGMGLAISKRIIERHGGKIRLKPLSDNETVIYFTIPIIK